MLLRPRRAAATTALLLLLLLHHNQPTSAFPLHQPHPYDNLASQASLHAPSSPYTAVLVVPTGVGASIGGYAGDALPVAKGLASIVDTLITHPNVMNGAALYAPQDNILYTEGYALDEFAAGKWGLAPFLPGRGGHRIGLVLDKAMEEDMRLRHLQVADGMRATLGLNIGGYTITDEPLGVGIALSPGGASWGRVKRPGTLLRAARKLVEEGGCTALAIVGRFPDDEDQEMLQAYREGHGVDCVGGAEAIISHLVTSELKVPCAHAPALPPLDVDPSVSPKACGEEIGYTFLSCVLANLHRAPLLIPSRQDNRNKGGGGGGGGGRIIWKEDVSAIIAPASAVGGPGVLGLLGDKEEGGGGRGGTLLVAVEENETCMEARAEDLFPKGVKEGRVVRVKTYLEAMGLLAAHKTGINPAALTASIPSVREL